MTTIAVCSEYFAADSQMSGNYVSECKKIFRVNGVVIGIAGSICEAYEYVDWWKDGASGEPPIADDLNALVYRNGKLFLWEGQGALYQVKIPCAIGSGSQFAMAAMWLGHDAKTAIRTARQFDSGTGGRIQTIRLK